MQKFNNQKFKKNKNQEQQECFIQNNFQQFEKMDKYLFQQSLQLKFVHKIVKEHFPANQLRTVRRPNKMVARTLFKQVPFYLLPKDLQMPGQEIVFINNINSNTNMALTQTSNIILNKTSNGQISNNFNEKSNLQNNMSQTQSNNFTQTQNQNSTNVKKISPKLINKDQLSLYQYFAQSFFQCVYRKYKQNQKSILTNGKATASKFLIQNINTEKMHCIESLADYNWKAFKQLKTQSYQGYLFQKQQIKNCQQNKKKFLHKITSKINSNTFLNFTTINYKDKDKIKFLKQSLNQSQQKISIQERFQRQKQIQILSQSLKLKISLDSNFECGNMCFSFVHKDRPKDIYLFLENDTNTHGYNNWFFFRLRMILQANHSQKQQISLRFHIVNMTKNSSMYKQGMLISIFSMKQYIQKGLGWFKGGNNINMMSTGFQRSNHPNDFFVSLSFQYTFTFDFCFEKGKITDQQQIYFAMNKPYTYTRLIQYLLDYKKLDFNFKEEQSDEIFQQTQEKQQKQKTQIQKSFSQQTFQRRQSWNNNDYGTFIRINTNSSICNIQISDDQEDQLNNKNIQKYIKIEDTNGIRFTDQGTTSHINSHQINHLANNLAKTQIQQKTNQFQQKNQSEFFVQIKNIGYTLSNNILPIMIIGLGKKQQILKRKAILFLGRQHPSQTMGSFVTQGVMNFFKLSANYFKQKNQQSFPFDEQTKKHSHQSNFLMKKYQIVFIPMINPDGVIHGNSRCNFAGLDLNRRWDQDSLKQLTPQTYRIRSFILQLHKQCGVSFMVDLHGHGKKLNSFIFACKNQKSQQKDKSTYRLYNYAISKLEPRFNLASCTYGIQRDKINTIRNQLYQCGVSHCYTLQNSFYGYNTGLKIKHYSQRDFFEIGKSTVLGIYMILASNYKFQRQICFKKHGFNKQSLIQQLSTLADKLDKQEKFCLNDKQMLSDSDPQGDVLNVQQRLIVIKDTSKALSKKVKDSFGETSVGLNILPKQKKNKGIKNSKLNSKRQNVQTNKLLKAQAINQRIKTQNQQNLQLQKDSDSQSQEQKRFSKNKKDNKLNENKQKIQENNLINTNKMNKFTALSKRWTQKKKWNPKNISQELRDHIQNQMFQKKETNIIDNNEIILAQTFQKFQKRFNPQQNTTKVPNFYQINKKKYTKHSKIKTQASLANPKKNITEQVQNQQKIGFQTQPLANSILNQGSHRRSYSKTRFHTQNPILKNQNDLKYKMLKQQSLKALLTDSLSILKIDPKRKGTKPTQKIQRQKGKSYSGYRMKSQNNKKMSKGFLQTAYEGNNINSLINGYNMTKNKFKSKQKFQASGRVFSQHGNRCQTQPNSSAGYSQLKDGDSNIKKYKRFESFIQEKSYNLFHKQSKAQNNSVFYYFPVL